MATNSPCLRKCRTVLGPRLNFRIATVEDAEFILSLRLDKTKNKHLSKVTPDIAAQEEWLRICMEDTSQVYFIIGDYDDQSVGTVRLYDVQGDLFSWGSWILTDQAPRSSAVESTLMVYHYGLSLGFAGAHFEVRRANDKVWQYHERFGAIRVREDNENYYYEINQSAINAAFDRYRSRIPNGILIEF